MMKEKKVKRQSLKNWKWSSERELKIFEWRRTPFQDLPKKSLTAERILVINELSLFNMVNKCQGAVTLFPQ